MKNYCIEIGVNDYEECVKSKIKDNSFVYYNSNGYKFP